MRVYTFSADGPARLELDGLDEHNGPRIGWGDGPPVEGYWKVGDRIFSNDKAAPLALWTCYEEGAPGLWTSGLTVGAGVRRLDSGVLIPNGAGFSWDGFGQMIHNGLGFYQLNLPRSTATDIRQIVYSILPTVWSETPYTENFFIQQTYPPIGSPVIVGVQFYVQRGVVGQGTDSVQPISIGILQYDL